MEKNLILEHTRISKLLYYEIDTSCFSRFQVTLAGNVCKHFQKSDLEYVSKIRCSKLSRETYENYGFRALYFNFQVERAHMAQKRAAVMTTAALGDGLLMAIVAYNLKRAGYDVTFFHPLAKELSPLFNAYSLTHYPPSDQLEATLRSFDSLIIQNNYSQDARFLLNLSKKPSLCHSIIFHTGSKSLGSNRPYKVDRLKPIASQLASACQQLFNLKTPSKENGLLLPSQAHYRYHQRQIVIHPTGSTPSKCWEDGKFIHLSTRLEGMGYRIVFSVHPKDRAKWLAKASHPNQVPLLPNLASLAHLLYESFACIGNDSGVGHLASNLGVPTLTIARNRTKIAFWRPGWHDNRVVTPSSFIPNIKGWRMRDTYWKTFISVRSVYKAFLNFASSSL